MAEAQANLSGAQRAAIFLLGVGEESAATIMQHMEPREVQSVGEAMASLAAVSNEQLAQVLTEFHEKAGQVNALGLEASEFAERVITQALGEQKARSMLAQVMPGKAQKNRCIESLKWMDAREIRSLIEEEHPQIIAIVLSSLNEELAAQVLQLFDDESRVDIVLRIASLRTIDPSALEELDTLLQKQLGDFSAAPPQSFNGVQFAAALMNACSAATEASVMDALRAQHAELTDRIADLMFVFADLMALDDRGMQRLIRDISTDLLVIALKGADVALQERFFGNMSSRAAEMLREDLEAKGPVKIAEVESAQKEILASAKQLAEEGELMLGKGGDDFV
ncbi:MAG: flagellar motor switch protein FliG [Pseudomonadota bacterium]